MKNILSKIIFFLIICNPAFSADENIDMLNRLGKEINVYSINNEQDINLLLNDKSKK